MKRFIKQNSVGYYKSKRGERNNYAREMRRNKYSNRDFGALLSNTSGLYESDLEFIRFKTRNTKDSTERKLRTDSLFRLGSHRRRVNNLEEERYVKIAQRIDCGENIVKLMVDKERKDIIADLGCINEEDYCDEEGWF